MIGKEPNGVSGPSPNGTQNNLSKWCRNQKPCEQYWTVSLKFEEGFREQWLPTLEEKVVDFLEKQNESAEES